MGMGDSKPQITRNDVIRNFQKELLFMGQRYRKREIRSRGSGWHATWILLKRDNLEQKLKNFSKMSKKRW